MFRSFLLIAAAGSAFAADFVGSDVVSWALTEGVVESSRKEGTADFSGSLPGAKALAEGKAFAAILFQRPGEPTPKVAGNLKLREFPIANAAVIVGVHRSNAIDHIDFASLSGVFANDPRQRMINWNDVPGVTRSELITPGVCSPDNSFVRELFQGLVLNGAIFRPDVRQNISVELAADLVASRSSALQLMPQLPLGSVGRVLQVADGRPGSSTTAYSPDEMNIYNGDYPLRLPLVLFVRQDKLEDLKPVVRWLLSDVAASRLEKAGLHPTPKPIRDRFAQRLDTR
ncbi:MAG: hypothetical protein NTX20_01290 [Verrucomicrobia bacterium]|nr:hypothetical protein [Verrucomicrobiota bacterium]